MKTTIFTTLLISMSMAMNAQVQVTSVNTEFTEDFQNFNGSGFHPQPAEGQLDADNWSVIGFSDGDQLFSDTTVGKDLARGISAGGVGTGGLYAFQTDSSGNIALGVQPIGSDFTPGSINMRCVNQSGDSLKALELSYTIFCYNDQNRSSKLEFSYSFNGIDFFSVDTTLKYITPEEADSLPSWKKTYFNFTVEDFLLAQGDTFYLRWTGDDEGGSGSRDEYAIDDIAFKVIPLVNVTTGISKQEKNPLTIYPNPSSNGIFYLKEKKPYHVYDALGTLIIEGQASKVDLSGKPAGLYFIQIEEKVKRLLID